MWIDKNQKQAIVRTCDNPQSKPLVLILAASYLANLCHRPEEDLAEAPTKSLERSSFGNRYWMHRESFMATWLRVIDQVSLQVLQSHYPYDTIVATDRVHVQFGDFRMSGKITPESAIAMLSKYARTKIDFDTISNYSYCIYAEQVCTVVRRALNIKKLIYVNNIPFAQLPPTANYVLYYFKSPLLEIAQRKFVPSREAANVRGDVFSLICTLLIMPDNAADPITETNRFDLIRTIRHTIMDERQVQIVLPNVTMLLKNSLYTRPFIPQIFGLICKVLPEYARYIPDYLLIYTNLYIERLGRSNNYEASSIYIYGLTQLSFVTWSCKMELASFKQMVTSIVDAVVECDGDLEKYSHWDLYHQIFIDSIHCLSVWISSSKGRSAMSQDSISKVMSLLSRFNRFIRSAAPISNTSDIVMGRRVWLTSSLSDDNIIAYGELGLDMSKADLNDDKVKHLTTVSTNRVFGKEATVKLPHKHDEDKDQKTHSLSNTLYKVLSTLASVFSTLLLRSMDSEQLCASLTPVDMVLARMGLYQNVVPNTKTLLRGCSPTISKMLEGYVPISIEFFSAYRQAIYSKINLKRFQDGKWSDVAILTTARYPSGSKQWVSFPSMPTSLASNSKSRDSQVQGQTDDKASSLSKKDDDVNVVDKGKDSTDLDNKDDSLSWVRMSSGTLYCSKLRTGFQINSQGLKSTKCIRPLIDKEDESRIEENIAEDFLLQHSTRDEPEIQFTPTFPFEQQPRGNSFSRVNLQFFSYDVTSIDISEEMLATIDKMDELTRPFSAQLGVIYLHSPRFLSIDRRYAKGPLLGVSSEFKQFLKSIGQFHSTPKTRMKRHPDDPTLIRYTFAIDSNEIGYNLAPNVSSLISKVPMTARNNQVFYKNLQARGITETREV
ncbi:hypothetical protein EV177_006012 [Coemansia sp. RSA 1804]|nr:hypothetical protein EV177_006012 [Coemansia sp. RSA 1804]